MHYIAGTVIQAPAGKSAASIRPGMTSQQIRAASRGPVGFNDQISKLTPGKQYTLIRIYKVNEDVVYVFSSTTGDRVELTFPDISSAERFISNVKGETIPDYNDAYRNQSD
jgi:hypothetical protein